MNCKSQNTHSNDWRDYIVIKQLREGRRGIAAGSEWHSMAKVDTKGVGVAQDDHADLLDHIKNAQDDFMLKPTHWPTWSYQE